MSRLGMGKLAKKYGIQGISGKKYRDVVQEIIRNGTENIARTMARRGQARYERALAQDVKAGKLVLPDWEDFMPKSSTYTRKAAESGTMISETLRDRMTSTLRETLVGYRNKTGTAGYVRTAGKAAGRIDNDLIGELEKNLTGVFHEYTRSTRNPRSRKIEMPSNVRAIAITEARSAIHQAKDEYARALREKNPSVRLRKRWIHHPSFSKGPRPGHRALNGTTVDFDAFFEVPEYVFSGKRYKPTGNITRMRHPHDPSAPPSEVINCNCDFDILVDSSGIS